MLDSNVRFTVGLGQLRRNLGREREWRTEEEGQREEEYEGEEWEDCHGGGLYVGW